jgi:hypothetical protein
MSADKIGDGRPQIDVKASRRARAQWSADRAVLESSIRRLRSRNGRRNCPLQSESGQRPAPVVPQSSAQRSAGLGGARRQETVWPSDATGEPVIRTVAVRRYRCLRCGGYDRAAARAAHAGTTRHQPSGCRCACSGCWGCAGRDARGSAPAVGLRDRAGRPCRAGWPSSRATAATSRPSPAGASGDGGPSGRPRPCARWRSAPPS